MLPREFSEAATRLSQEHLAERPVPETIADGRLPSGEQLKVYKGKAKSGSRAGMGHFLIVMAATSTAGGEVMSETMFSGSRDVRHPSKTESGRGTWSILTSAGVRIVFPSEEQIATAGNTEPPVLVNRQLLLPPLEVIEGGGEQELPLDVDVAPDTGGLRAVQ